MGKLIELPVLANTKKFEIQNKAGETAEIFIYGEIGDNPWSDSAISEKKIVAELQKLPKTIKQINVRVNSGGGAVFSGVTIYELLKNHPAKVTAYVEGIAASIASVIIMAADEIVISEAGMIMLHKPLVGVYGNVTELERMIDILDKIESQMISIYAKKTKKTRVELAKILSDETYFTAEEAIEAGLADRVMDATDESRYLAASIIENSNFKRMPQMKSTTELVKEKLKKLTNNADTFLNNK